MTKHLSLVAYFIQYDDIDPFYPIIFQCAVADLLKAVNYHGKLTDKFCYWTPYTSTGGNPVLLLFGIGAGVTVRSIILLPTILQWGCMIDIGNRKLIAPAIETVFLLMFELSKNGPSGGVSFDA